MRSCILGGANSRNVRSAGNRHRIKGVGADFCFLRALQPFHVTRAETLADAAAQLRRLAVMAVVEWDAVFIRHPASDSFDGHESP